VQQLVWYLSLAARDADLCCVCHAVAPAGSYFDKGTGKKCPKGTYTTGLNQLSVCIPCGDGVTTAAEGSTAESACDRALPGYKYTGSNTAAKCDLDTYNPAESTSSTCTPCPFSEWPCWLVLSWPCWLVPFLFCACCCYPAVSCCSSACVACLQLPEHSANRDMHMPRLAPMPPL